MARLADSLHLDFINSAVSSKPVERRSDIILSLFYGVSGYFDSLAQKQPYLEELYEAIEALIERYPQAALQQGPDGDLPIQLLLNDELILSAALLGKQTGWLQVL